MLNRMPSPPARKTPAGCTTLLAVLILMCSIPAVPDRCIAQPGGGGGEPAPPWPMFRGGPARTGLSAVDTAWNTGEELWKLKLGSVIYSSPAIGSDGTIYVGCSDDYIYAVRPDGTILWKLRTGKDVTCSPAIGPDGTVYAGSDGLYAIRPDGIGLWKHPTLYGMSSSPVVSADGRIIFGTVEGTLFVLTRYGKVAGTFNASRQIASSPALDEDGNIYFGSSDGWIYSLSPDMVLRWKYQTGGEVGASPAIGPGRMVYAGSRDGFLYALNETGCLAWRRDLGRQIFSSAALGPDGTLYVGCDDGRLCAINPGGTLQWDHMTGWWVSSSPSVGADGTVYVGSGDGSLYAFRPNGTVRWRFPTGSEVFGSPAIASNGSVIFGSWDNHLYCVGARYARPSAPEDLGARLNASAVELDWKAPSSDGGRPITAYRIFRGSSVEDLNTIAAVSGRERAYTDRNLTGPGVYCYKVTAVNSIGESPPAGPVELMVRTRPLPPRNLRAEAGDGSVRLGWEAPVSDGGAPVESFRIYWSGGNGSGSLLVEVEEGVRSFSQANLANLVTYSFEVTAVNTMGESDPSAGASATPRPEPAGLPGPPREVSARSYDRAVDVHWAAAESPGGHPVLRYRIYRGTAPEGPALLVNLSAGSRSFRDLEVANGRTYWYFITAENDIGESALSEGAMARPLGSLRDGRPPDVYILIPKDGAVVHSSRLQVRGEAQDLSGISRVELGLDEERWLAAVGTTEWAGNLTLSPGPNTVYVRATDGWDNNATARIVVMYEPPAVSVGSISVPLVAAVLLIAAVLVQGFVATRRWRRR